MSFIVTLPVTATRVQRVADPWVWEPGTVSGQVGVGQVFGPEMKWVEENAPSFTDMSEVEGDTFVKVLGRNICCDVQAVEFRFDDEKEAALFKLFYGGDE